MPGLHVLACAFLFFICEHARVHPRATTIKRTDKENAMATGVQAQDRRDIPSGSVEDQSSATGMLHTR